MEPGSFSGVSTPIYFYRVSSLQKAGDLPTPSPNGNLLPQSSAPAEEDNQSSLPLPSAGTPRITQEQALTLIQEQYGLADEETGFTYSWGFDEMTTIDGVEYFNFRMTWLVTDPEGNTSHMSYLTNVFVSADGQSIRTGVYDSSSLQWVLD